MKICTSLTLFQDSVGMRMSMTYSEIDESGKIVSDNKRVDRVLTDQAAKEKAGELMAFAQSFIDSLEG